MLKKDRSDKKKLDALGSDSTESSKVSDAQKKIEDGISIDPSAIHRMPDKFLKPMQKKQDNGKLVSTVIIGILGVVFGAFVVFAFFTFLKPVESNNIIEPKECDCENQSCVEEVKI